MDYKERIITPSEAVTLEINRQLDTVNKVKNHVGSNKWNEIKIGKYHELCVKQYAMIVELEKEIKKLKQ